MNELVIEAVNRERLSDSVSRQLKQLIIERSMSMGEALPSESELANRFGVSKSVIREALRSLAAMGVVEIKQGKLATVGVPSSEPLFDFLSFAVRGTRKGLQEAIEIRRILETETAALAAERITDEEMIQLEAQVAILRDSLEDVEPWVKADVAFHTLIAKSAKNSLMLYLVEALAGVFSESIRVLHQQHELRDAKATLMRHEKILEALGVHDVAAARAAMQTHFDATIPVILALAENGKR